RHHVEVERHALDAVQRADRALHLILEARTQRAPGDGQRDRDRHVTAVDLDRTHHVELRDGLAQLGVDHPAERLQHRLARDAHCPATWYDAVPVRRPEVAVASTMSALARVEGGQKKVPFHTPLALSCAPRSATSSPWCSTRTAIVAATGFPPCVT